jgi:UDP-glucose-4-epimerase GalE
VPVDEDHPHRPINPYGRSKLYVEHMLADANQASGLPWVALRYFNAAGCDPDGEIGERHDPETHLIPIVVRAALTSATVSIFGDDYDTPDGTCIRDYIHVNDLADAHILALKYLARGGKSCGINLANSQGFSVKEVLATVERVCGRSVAVKVGPRRPGDPAVLIGKTERAKELLGWSPKRSDLELQVRDAWNWYEKFQSSV